MPWWVFLIAGLFIFGTFLLGLYNGLVKARNMTDEAWSGVDVQLKRRRDLIPNLVETVKGYAAHEAQTLQEITEDRVVAESASHGGPGPAAPAENRLTQDLRNIFAIAERYPDLKADANFRQLSAELVNIENNVAGARAIYNGNARAYNDRVQSFPSNLFAATLGFRPRSYVEAAARERGEAKVEFK
jgi:LemA protein